MTIIEGIEDYAEMRCFHVVNTRHKGVPTDVVDRHLVSMREVEGDGLIETMGERSYLRAQKANLLEVIDIEGKLADLRQRIGVPAEAPSEDSQREQEVTAS